MRWREMPETEAIVFSMDVFSHEEELRVGVTHGLCDGFE